MPIDVEQELAAATAKILDSKSPKKLIVAGPGAGKTTIFKRLLEGTEGDNSNRLVLTFINNLKDDLEKTLSDDATVFTLHGYCQSLLHQNGKLRDGLSRDFRCLPGMASLIKKDWVFFNGEPPPAFVALMRELTDGNEWDFYKTRANYYDAVDFDDSVYRTYQILAANPDLVKPYYLILIDEYQDFNRLEAGLINLLGQSNPIVIAGDDDQALYSKLKGASWEFIRSMYSDGEYEIFELPFCMRCPEVIVNAVNDVLSAAREAAKLDGRIEKPFAHYAPVKGLDSEKYPVIDLVTTSVQRANANYFGRYIEQEIQAISEDEIRQANDKGEPTVMVIGSRPYLPQVAAYLRSKGFEIETSEGGDLTVEKSQGLEILKYDSEANLGWRIILDSEPPAFARGIVKTASENNLRLVETFSEEFKEKILAEVQDWSTQSEENENQDDIDEKAKDGQFRIKLTSFEGAKGLSAQHVFIIGMHEGELPRDTMNIEDIEICRFLVGLTRTKKKCTLVCTRKFGDKWKNSSVFLSWINKDRFNAFTVDAAYWAGKP